MAHSGQAYRVDLSRKPGAAPLKAEAEGGALRLRKSGMDGGRSGIFCESALFTDCPLWVMRISNAYSEIVQRQIARF
jgi:hypothetical protein